MENYKYLLIVPVLAAVLLVVPPATPAHAGGSVALGFSFSVPLYDAYPTYYYPSTYSSYGYRGWDDRPYWRGRYWDRHDHRFFKHRHPGHRDRFGRHHDFDRHDHRRHRGFDRW